MYVLSNDSEMVILADENTKIVNEPRDNFIFLARFPILVLAVTVNIWAGLVIGKKDDTGINKIIVCDCVVNALSMSLDTFYINSPWSILKSPFPCYIIVFVHILMLTWNRLVPVAIALLRYIMVCQPAFFINQGKEAGVWRKILGVIISLCLALWVLIIFSSSNSVAFLRCMGREEAFW